MGPNKGDAPCVTCLYWDCLCGGDVAKQRCCAHAGNDFFAVRGVFKTCSFLGFSDKAVYKEDILSKDKESIHSVSKMLISNNGKLWQKMPIFTVKIEQGPIPGVPPCFLFVLIVPIFSI